MDFLYHPRGQCFSSPIGICQSLHKEFLLATFKCHWICWLLSSTWQSSQHYSMDLLQSLFGIWSPLQTGSLMDYLVNGSGNITHVVYVASRFKKKKLIKHCSSAVVVGHARHSNFLFTLKGILQYTPDY